MRNLRGRVRVFRQGSDGLSLIEVVFGIGLFSLLIAGAMTLVKSQTSGVGKAHDKLKMAMIEHYLIVAPSCPVTFTRNPDFEDDCDSNKEVDIYDAAGQVILPKAGRQFGTTKVVSRCEQGMIKFFVEPDHGPLEPIIGGVPLLCVQPYCLTNMPRSKKISNGFIEFLDDSYKPGDLGHTSAFNGKLWADGAGAYGAGTNTFDVRICPKIGFVERGHTLTRTLLFKTPDNDYSFEFTVHRTRFRLGDSYGIMVYYHFDKRLTTLTRLDMNAGTITQSSGSYKWAFNTHKDYQFKCNYTFASDSISCTVQSAPVTVDDCTKYQEWNQVATGGCANFN